MSARRRKPDGWADIHPGDIVSFDTRSPVCPPMTYVREVMTRDDGKHALVGTLGERIVEHTSYRMRLDQRHLTIRLQEEGVIDPLVGWSATLTYDWKGKRAPVVRMDPAPLRVPVWLYWEAPSGRIDENTELFVKLWVPPERQVSGDLRSDVMRLAGDALELVERGTPLHGLDDITFTAAGDPAPFDELFATGIRRLGPFKDEPTPGAREALTAVARWVSAHRNELQDPQHRPGDRA